MRTIPPREGEPLIAHVSLHFELGDDGVLTIKSMSLPELHLSGSDYPLLFKQLGPEIGRLLVARPDEVSFETELRVRWTSEPKD